MNTTLQRLRWLSPPWPGLLVFKLNWLLLVFVQNKALLVSVVLLIPAQFFLLPASAFTHKRVLLLCLAFALAGITMDQLLGVAGLFEFPDQFIPWWLMLLWLSFSLALQNISQLLLPLKPWILVIGSSIAGCVAYGAGMLSGAVQFGRSTGMALSIIAVCWTLVLPLQRVLQRLLLKPATTRMLLPGLLCIVATLTSAPSSRAEETAWVTVGEGSFRYFLLKIYDAKLEAVQPNFRFPQTRPFALTLVYKLDLDASELIDNTLDQWRQQKVEWPMSWQTLLQQTMPQISKGDSLRLEVSNEQSAVLLHNGKEIASFADSAFVTAFAGIWLDERSTAPKLRNDLLGTHL